MHKWHDTTDMPIVKFVDWLGIARAKFYEWRRRYGTANKHNAKISRDHWTPEPAASGLLSGENGARVARRARRALGSREVYACGTRW